MSREFTAKPAIRSEVPLLVGLMGPSGGGKTFSALRMAKGIQKVRGGEIYFVDTEAGRAKHYADNFEFQHVEFGAPFGSLDYLEVIRFCKSRGAGVVVIDSFSHEHDNIGGMVDTHDKELTRMAGSDFRKRQSMQLLAWQKPKADRRKLINGVLQLDMAGIFCFRAKQTSKPMNVDGKNVVVPMGYMPIAGEEFIFEMTVNALLLPGARGVPTWVSDNLGEKQMIKLPRQFENLFQNGRALDEDVGEAMARWAKGDVPTAKVEVDVELLRMGDEAAARGMDVLATYWGGLTKEQKQSAGGAKQLALWKDEAARVDALAATHEDADA